MKDTIKSAVDIAQRAQRNYDLSKSIPSDDLQTLIYAATNCPSKQNETHYQLKVYTDQDIIRSIYNTTKKFTMRNRDHLNEMYAVDGKLIAKDKAIHNSQILANALFVYIEDDGQARGGTHLRAQKNRSTSPMRTYEEQRNFSIGISVGQLTLTSALLGYRTGVCSAYEQDEVREITKSTRNIKLLVGVGYENVGVDRQLHAETLNKDIWEPLRNGDPDELWRFPSFPKNIRVTINE